MAFFDGMVCRLSRAGKLTRESLAVLVAALGREEIEGDMDVSDDRLDAEGRTVYELVPGCVGLPAAVQPPDAVDYGDSPEATAAWDAYWEARRAVFWQAIGILEFEIGAPDPA